MDRCVATGLFGLVLAWRAAFAAFVIATLVAMAMAMAAGVARAADAGPDDRAPLQAVSGDGRFVLVAQAEPPCLVVLDAASGAPVHTIVPAARDGRVARRIAALHTAPLRRSFVVAPADVAELWEISYDPRAEEIYDGLVHDWRFGEGVPRRGFLGLRRTTLPEPIADFVLDPHEAEAWGLAAAPPGGSGEGQVVNLDVRRRVAVRTAEQMRAALAARRAALPVAVTASPPAGTPVDKGAERGAEHRDQRRTASRSWTCAPPNVRAP